MVLTMTYRRSCGVRTQWFEEWICWKEREGGLQAWWRGWRVPSWHFLSVFLLTSRFFKLLVHICLLLFWHVTAMWSPPFESPNVSDAIRNSLCLLDIYCSVLRRTFALLPRAFRPLSSEPSPSFPRMVQSALLSLYSFLQLLFIDLFLDHLLCICVFDTLFWTL